MHDTILLNNISQTLNEICLENKIKKIKKVHIIVNFNSHVNLSNLYEHLKIYNGDLVGEWTEIQIDKQNIQEQAAILKSIEGDIFE